MIPRAFEDRFRDLVRRAALGILAATLLATVVSGWILVRARAGAGELKLQRAGRQTRLSADRRTASTLPKGPQPAALDRSRAVSTLRATLAVLAAQKGITLSEFQASTEEAPYLTVYAADANDPGWTQVPVKVALQGRSTAVIAAVAALRKMDVPFEIDTLELSRRSTDTSGMARVAAQIGMRVLVYRGEG